MIKVLHVLSSLGGGGVEKMLFEYFCKMNHEEFMFDFVVHGNKEGMLEKKLKNMGSAIYHVTPKKVSFIKNYLEIKNIIKNNDYDIVEVHQNFSSFPALFAAWLCGVRVRIIHSHGFVLREKITIPRKIYRFLNKVFATHFVACTPEAALWLYGKDSNAQIIYNAINVDKFKFNYVEREKMRKQLGLKYEDICLLQVGRFSHEKNHKFSVNILRKLNSSKYYMVFAGDGNEEEIKQYVKDNKLEERVIFLGCVDNVGELMCAADILLFPSKNEGFGIVAIEAQVNNLYVLASNTIPGSTKITDNIEYLSIDNVDVWLEKIKGYRILNREVENVVEKFDVGIQTKVYEEYLKQLAEKKKC